jgi:hypothetical protein
MRCQTVPGLREELAERTQQRIVRIAARDCCRLGNGRRPSGVPEESAGGTRDGYGPLFYGYLPAMRHHQDELRQNDEQAQQRLEAVQDGTAHLPGCVTLGSIHIGLGDQRGFPQSQEL